MICHDLIYCMLVCIGNALDHICLQMCYRVWWNLTWKNGVKSRSRCLWLLMYDMLWCMAETAFTLQASLEYSPMLNAKYHSYRISKIETELTFRNLSFIYNVHILHLYECFKPGYGVPKSRYFLFSRDIQRLYFQGFQFFLLWNCGDCHNYFRELPTSAAPRSTFTGWGCSHLWRWATAQVGRGRDEGAKNMCHGHRPQLPFASICKKKTDSLFI